LRRGAPREEETSVGVTVAPFYSLGVGYLVMLFGGLVGAAASIVLTYGLFSGVELDGLLVMTGIFLCFLGTLLGARLALWLWRFAERNATPSPRL
jgi:hypothetical protein